MIKILITTVPFGEKNRFPLELLEQSNIEYLVNPLNRKLTENELAEMAKDFDIIIAGTEPITEFVMSNAPRLKLISRVGIGLDSVDLVAAEKRGIQVTYTPDAPSPAVAELTIGLIISLMRSVHLSNIEMHNGEWHRYFGKRIAESTIGIIGLGRIGVRVLNRLSIFGTPRLLVNDILPNKSLNHKFKLEWVDKKTIYKEADLISLHVPLSRSTKNLITIEELNMMKPNANLINLSRGGVINEDDLYTVMKNGHLSGAAIDVFEKEPYNGPLKEINRCILTAHMGSMSYDCRALMEIQATEDVVRYVSGKEMYYPVPNDEYEVQKQGF